MKIRTEIIGNVKVITLQGDLTRDTVPGIEHFWDDAVSGKDTVLAVDFGEVNYIDSLGLSHLGKLSKYAETKKVELILYNLKEPAQKLFLIAGLDRFFKILTKKEFDSLVGRK